MRRTGWKILGLCALSNVLGATAGYFNTTYVIVACVVAMGFVGWCVGDIAQELER